MRRPAADLGDGFLMRAAALSQNGPNTSLPCPHPVHVRPEVHEVGKITLDRLLIGTQPSVQGSELVRGQPSWRSPGWWRVRRRRDRVGDLGVVAASKGVQAEKCGWYWPVLCAEGDEFRSGVLPEKARWECAFAKWLRFWKRRHGPA